MTKARRWLALLAAMLLTMGLAACGGDDDGGGGAADGGTGGGDLGLPNLEGQSLEVAAVWTGTEQERFMEVISRFEEATGASVTYTATGDDIATVLGTRIQGGDAPDIAMIPQPGLLRDLAQQDALISIEEAAGGLVDENYAPVWRELGSVDGTLYGVFFKAANKSTVWYRPSAFEDAGVQPPETWEEFLDVANTLADAGITPVAIAGGDGWTLTDWFENAYLQIAGPEKYDQLTAHEIPWTDQSVKDTLSTLAELWGQEELIVGGASGALGTEFVESVVQVFGEPPQGAIVYEGDFVLGEIEGETTTELPDGADFFAFPRIGDAQPGVVGGGDAAVMLQDTEAARAFISYAAMPESAEIWAELGGFTSPNQQVDLEVYPNELIRQAAEQLTGADTFRFDMSDLTPPQFGGTPSQGMWQILQDFLRGPQDVDATAQQLEQAAAAAYGG